MIALPGKIRITILIIIILVSYCRDGINEKAARGNPSSVETEAGRLEAVDTVMVKEIVLMLPEKLQVSAILSFFRILGR